MKGGEYLGLVEKVYSVLVVSSVKSFDTAMSSMLPASSYKPVLFADSISCAQRMIAERSFDFVIINAPLSDDLGIGFAVDCATDKGAVVLFAIRNEIHDEIYERLSPYGVFTLSKPISHQSMRNTLAWLRTAKNLTRRYDKKATSVEDKMSEIRLVNKAKWLLISKENMTEPEAHRYLEKEAMNRCITKKSLAEEIIDKYK